MKIGKYELRLPWTYYEDVTIEEEIYVELRILFGEQIAKEIETKCDSAEVGCGWNDGAYPCSCEEIYTYLRGQK